MSVISINIAGFPAHLGVTEFLFGLLNKSVVRLGNSAPIGVSLIYNKANVIIIIKAFLIIYFTNLKHASTCPLLWWWYDEFMAWSMLSCPQNSLKLSDMTPMSASNTTFLHV